MGFNSGLKRLNRARVTPRSDVYDMVSTKVSNSYTGITDKF
jgi:hypothetical protein